MHQTSSCRCSSHYIQQLTGHKNVQTINNYAIASNEMQHQMSNILSNKSVALNPVNKQYQPSNATTPPNCAARLLDLSAY